MGGVLSAGLSLASLACNTVICATTCASCCMGAGGSMSLRAAKTFYIVLLGLATLLALFFRYNGDDLGIDLGAWQVHCSGAGDLHSLLPGARVGGVQLTADGEYYMYCKGDAAVYRISFVLAAFFGGMALLSLADGGATTRGWWAAKLGLLALALLVCMFMSNAFFDNSGYAWLARVGASVFLCLQVLILIDFSYQANDSMVARAFPDDGSERRGWLVAILGSAAALYLGALVAIPLLFVEYGECTEGVVFSALTLAGVVVFTVLTLFRDRLVGEEGAILPAAVVAAYSTFLCWSALAANPEAECAPAGSAARAGGDAQGDGAHHTANLVVGICVATASLMWTSFSVTESLEGLVSGAQAQGGASGGGADAEAATPLYTVETADGEARVAAEPLEGGGAGGERVWVFHLVLMSASMYMGMLLTNWGASERAHGNESGSVGVATMWVKIASQWLTMLLYMWTLVAPKVLADRDFDF